MHPVDVLEEPLAGRWRLRVEPPGRRFGWRGRVYASDCTTGILETSDPTFAAALRKLTPRDRIVEV